MKRWLIVMGLVLLSVPAISRAADMQFGFKGGLAMANLTGDDVDSDGVESRNGFVGGAFLQADFSPNFGVRVEGLYHMKGASADSSGFTATFKLDYIEFPMLLVAQLPASETATVQFFAGPVVGFNMNAELEGSAGGFTGSFDIGDYVADFEFGLALGAGIGFDVGSMVVGVDGRYDMGLTTIDDDSNDADDIKNKGFSFMASVGFPIGAN